MKNNFKKITSAAALVAMLASGSVFAEEVMLIDAEAPVVEDATTTEAQNLPVEPMTVKFEIINGVKMLPLRSIAEHFGYTVEWIDESQSVTLTKGANYIIFTINEDSYAFSRMAPQPLGAAPALFNNETTYVPVAFFTELLNLNCAETDDNITVSQPRIVSLISIDENGSILVLDEFFGEVLAHVSEETVITANGEKVSADILKDGQLLEVEYANHMTMSIPPQTNAIAIEVLNLPVGE